MKPHVLVVDDNVDLARAVALTLEPVSDRITVAHSAEAALAAVTEEPPQLVFSDMRMPGIGGLGMLEAAKERWPRARVVLFTGFATVDSAVDAMKRGAFDYLTKPFTDDELLLVAERAVREVKADLEIARLRAELTTRDCFHGLCWRDRRMLPVVETLRRVAPTHATVFISGESGTGKERVARALHAESGRAHKPFVAFNASAIPESLVEAELFGAKRGSYTGADRDRRGLFLEADGGTMFIDELSSMPPSLQSKLLRVLQEREVLAVGASTPVKVDVRVVAATNVEPQQLLATGALRRDLYYRLAVVRVHVPPLRERPLDVPLLAQMFLERLGVLPGGSTRTLSAGAMRLLLTHDWPGNVRELENVIERTAVLCGDDEIGPQDVRFEDIDVASGSEVEEDVPYEHARRSVVERFQRRYFERLLAECEGNLSACARRAEITRAAVQRILKRLGMEARATDGAASTRPPPLQ